jgi:flavin reductase (DIM6/NTAB) family NADH-FMN oxidoreductase RutF
LLAQALKKIVVEKQKLGPVNAMYPSLVTIVGTMVEGKPNWITISHVGIMTFGVISLGMGKKHFSNQGIHENKTFSVNLPSVHQRVETDYVGLVSGARADKSACFTPFYGSLATAPMIAECPVCMECRLVKVVDFPTHDVFMGEVVETYADERVLAGGKIDYAALEPLLFDFQQINYWSLGKPVGKPWKDGKVMKKKA